MSYLKYVPVLALLAACTSAKKMVTNTVQSSEPHRPQIHFTPAAHWMNDPNGLVYYSNTYHLFYQYYPDSTVWGPMHWGHATSNDLLHWQHQPIALYPDSLGYIFSGSAVVDVHNTSGFGSEGKVPLVAIFTHHDPVGEKAGNTTFQNQGIAYSLDEGKTWIKYAGNPVVKNPGIRDFRDPKVTWYDEGKKWIMTLATQDHITFLSSADLKSWKKESEFGKNLGAHGGVWECPDLFTLPYGGEKIWVLTISLNPGGPNGGSATQYFTGKFDGTSFVPFQTDTRWVDYGPDDYAGVTYSNTGDRKIFIGWMSNWQYAMVVPTGKWRSATTIPRDLHLQKIGEKYFLASKPVPELDRIAAQPIDLGKAEMASINGPMKLTLQSENLVDFSITLYNTIGQKLVVGYSKPLNQFYMDRTTSGKVSFEKGFAKKHTAPRLGNKASLDVTLIIDKASAELFADDGLTVMTQIFFPDKDFSAFSLQSTDRDKLKLQYSRLQPAYAVGPVAAN